MATSQQTPVGLANLSGFATDLEVPAPACTALHRDRSRTVAAPIQDPIRRDILPIADVGAAQRARGRADLTVPA